MRPTDSLMAERIRELPEEYRAFAAAEWLKQCRYEGRRDEWGAAVNDAAKLEPGKKGRAKRWV